MEAPRIVTVHDDTPLMAQVAQALNQPGLDVAALPTMTNVALGDPYLAQQLIDLHHQWELRPPAAHSLLARIRTRLAWWFLGREFQQMSQTNAILVRIIDSLIVQLDQDRAARRRIEEHLAYREEQ